MVRLWRIGDAHFERLGAILQHFRGGSKFRCEDIMTPYERLKSLSRAAGSLNPGATFAQLDELADAVTENQAAKQLNQASDRRFREVERTRTPVT